jgi:hypothetical protein
MNQPSDATSAGTDCAPTVAEDSALARRALLKKIGRYVAVTPPAVTLLMAAGSKRAIAASQPVESSRQFKISEGAVDGAALSAAPAAMGEGIGLNAIDGIGTCLAAIKALDARLDMLEGELRPALL